MAKSGTYSKDNSKVISEALQFAKANVRANTREGRRFGGHWFMPSWFVKIMIAVDFVLALGVIYLIFRFLTWLML